MFGYLVPIRGTVWKRFRGVVLLEGVLFLRVDFEVPKDLLFTVHVASCLSLET